MSSKLSIIIVNWNGKEYLKICLASIFNQSYKNFEVIFVDNGSTDNSISFVKDNFPEVKIIMLDKNYGFVKGNNVGIKYALEKYNSDYVLLLNNDTKIVQRDFLKRLIEVAENDEEIGILGCKLIYPGGKIQHLGTKITRFRWVYLQKEISQEPYEVDSIMGAVFLIKNSVIERIGLLDEGFSPFLHEETDYCIRAKRARYLIKIVPALEVIHYWYRSMRKISPRYVSLISIKNSIRLKLLNDPLPYLIPKLFFTFPTCIFEEKDYEKKLTLWNLRVKENFLDNLLTYLNAWFINIKNLKEIIRKRANRNKKIWY